MSGPQTVFGSSGLVGWETMPKRTRPPLFVNLDDDLVDKLRDEAWQRHTSRAEVVREILRDRYTTKEAT